MSPVPTLKQLAAEKVVKHIEKIPYPIDEPCSTEILRLTRDVWRIHFTRFNWRNLRVKTLDFTDIKMYKHELEVAHSFVLESLTFGKLRLNANIVEVLKLALQQKSRHTLRHLDIPMIQVTFQCNWFEKALQLLPNLESIKIHKFPAPQAPSFKFSQLSDSLRQLDLSDSTIPSLQGISNLSNLTILILSHTKIRKSQSVGELSQLKRLAVLNISRNRRGNSDAIMSGLSEHCDSLPALKFIDCCFTDINNEGILKIQEISPKLEEIALYENSNYNPWILKEGIQCFDIIDLKSMMKLYDYMSRISETIHLEEIMKKIKTTVIEKLDEPENVPLVLECLDFLCKVETKGRGFKHDLSYVAASVTACLLKYSTTYSEFLNDRLKIDMVNALLRINSNYDGVYSFKMNIWTAIHQLDILSIPGAPPIFTPLVIAIFEDYCLTPSTKTLFLSLTESRPPSEKHFWANLAVRNLRKILVSEPAKFLTKQLAVQLCAFLLLQWNSEVDVEDVIGLLYHLPHFNRTNFMKEELMVLLRIMMTHIDRRAFQRHYLNQDNNENTAYQPLMILFNAIELKTSPYTISFKAQCERASDIFELLKYIIASMTEPVFNNAHRLLASELTHLLREQNREDDEFLPRSADFRRMFILLTETSANKLIEEALNMARVIVIEIEGEGRWNLKGEPLEENLHRDKSIWDVLTMY